MREIQPIIYIGIAGIVLLFLVVILVTKSERSGKPPSRKNERPGYPPTIWNIYEPPEKLAGEQGERFAAELIHSILWEDDLWLSNVPVSYHEERTELDEVIVNKNGVFIFEVKNYSGKLVGSETDYEWKKYHVSRGGIEYEKTVKNPIRQVKRQAGIFAHFLDWHGIDVWVDGYVLLLSGIAVNEYGRIVHNANEIEHLIHSPGKRRLDQKTIGAIRSLLYV